MSELMFINAKPKKRKTSGKKRARRAISNTGAIAQTAKKRRRRSPIVRKRTSLRRKMKGFKGRGFIKSTLMPSFMGAGGALATDIVLGVLPLPAAMKSGVFRPVTRIAGAIGLGLLVTKFISRDVGEKVTAGAVTVIMYDLIKGQLKTVMPTLNLGEDESLEYINAGYPAGQLVESDMSGGFMPGLTMDEYVSGMEPENEYDEMNEYVS